VSPPIQYEEEIQLLKKQLDDAHDELDKMKREKDTMLVQMKGKETAWERLVSSKESLSLQVEEKHEQHQRTQRELDQLAQHVEKLEADLAERDASIAKNIRNDEKQTQDQRRIERLESLVRELQQQIQNDAESHAQAQREHAGILDQVRREVSTGETMSAALEKECADLRRAGLEAMAAYEQSVLQINQQHLSQLHDKDEQMRQLQTVISELKRNILFDDEEMDIDAILKSSDASDQRHRLEEQLELTMAELDHERLIIKSQLNEMEQLKAEAVQLRAQKSSLEERYMALQTDLERELHDKKRLIEEADAAFEAQAKAEDEHYQMKLEKMAIEKELTLYKDDLIDKEKHELVQINKQLEQDCIKLMDDMLALEKQVEQGEWQSRVASLEKENLEQRKSLTQLELEKRTQVNQLSQDLAELESLVENKVLEEGDLEEQLDKERRKVVELERALKKYTLSPNTTTDDEVDDVKELVKRIFWC
jgi:chromosome segregation ATPase